LRPTSFHAAPRGIFGPGSIRRLSALELIKQNNFDVLITDIRLPPPIDGVEIVRRARKCFPSLKSLFISGESECRWDDPEWDDFVS